MCKLVGFSNVHSQWWDTSDGKLRFNSLTQLITNNFNKWCKNLHEFLESALSRLSDLFDPKGIAISKGGQTTLAIQIYSDLNIKRRF